MVIAASAIAVQHYPHQQQYHPQPQQYVAPTVLKKVVHEEADAHPSYVFEYNIEDGNTGDIKSQKETRDGDRVEGFYTVVDPDGHRRIVHYTADDVNGFQVRVDREEIKGFVAPPQPVKVYTQAPVHYSQPAPALQYVTPAPIKYVAPAPQHVHIQQQQPTIKYAAAPHYATFTSAPAAPKVHYQAPASVLAAPKLAQAYSHGASHVKFESPNANYVY